MNNLSRLLDTYVSIIATSNSSIIITIINSRCLIISSFIFIYFLLLFRISLLSKIPLTDIKNIRKTKIMFGNKKYENIKILPFPIPNVATKADIE